MNERHTAAPVTPARSDPSREGHNAETSLALAPATLAALMTASSEAIIGATTDGTITAWSSAAERLLGYTATEMVGQSLEGLVPPERADELPSLLAQLRQGETIDRHAMVLLRQDDQRITATVNVAPVNDSGGRLEGLVLVARAGTSTPDWPASIQEDQLTHIIHALPALIAYVDAEQRYRFVNKGYEGWFDQPRATLTGRYMREVLGEQTYAAVQPAVERALAGEQVTYEQERRATDGSSRWLQVTYVPDLAPDGRVLGFASLISDVTERKRREEALRLLADASTILTSSLDYETTLAQIARLVVPTLADYCIIDMIEADGEIRRVEVVHADPARAAVAQGLRRFPPDLRGDASRIVAALRTGQTIVVPQVSEDLLVGIAENSEHLDLLRALGPQAYIVLPLRARGRTLGAITLGLTDPGRQYTPEDQALAEELAYRCALAVDNARLYRDTQAAEVRYRGLFESVQDAIVVADAEGRFTDVNPAASRLLGYSRDELLQMQVGDLGADEPATSRRQFEQLKHNGRWRGEVELRRKDGTIIPAETWQTVVSLPTGRLYMGSWRDISTRRALERLERDFLAMVTHELKSPLTSIKALAQVMQRRGVYSERSLVTIVSQVDRVARLVEDLLDVSRLDAGRLELRLEPVDMIAAARESAEAAQALSQAHRVRLVAPATPLIGWWDRGRVEQILQNLLSNAIKYSPKGGAVTVQITDMDSAVEVAITDEGIGIPPEAQARLFRRFYRAESAAASRADGLGLGLYICKGLVEAHGGRIRVESTEGEGSTFTITLPYGQPPAE